MPVTSAYYLIYLISAVIIYYTVGHRYRAALLIAFSYAFYAINQSLFVLVLLASTLFNYLMCIRISKIKSYIYLIIVFNIALLSFFKYLPKIVTGFMPTVSDGFWNSIILPVGISFFTFQAMGYALDISWKGSGKQISFKDFVLYMSFFPQIMAGPIARSESFTPQIKEKKTFEYNNIANGLRLILWGSFKKLVIADNLKQYVDAVYNNPNMHSGVTIIIATALYTFQLYCDFSGYSDIAIGSAKLFGFRLLDNFRVPLLSQSVSDFWRRWHISLSGWVRDYVNNPIQYRYRKLQKAGVIIAVFITFAVIGIWHGPRWNFLLFGIIMGCSITFELFLKDWREKFWKIFPGCLSSILSTLLIFSLFSFSCMFLRANSTKDVFIMLSRITVNFTHFYIGSSTVILSAGLGLLLLIITEFQLRKDTFDAYISKKCISTRWSYYSICTILILAIGELDSGSFIYYQF